MDPEEIFRSLVNTHSQTRCALGPCVIHNRTAHHMRSWWAIWLEDRKIVERICPHGIGHPDPDQFGYWRDTDQLWQATHGCDGCCDSSVIQGELAPLAIKGELAEEPRQIPVNLSGDDKTLG